MRTAILLALVSGLFLTGQASAKEMKNATVCGASGCERQASGKQLEWLAQVGNQAEPPGGAPFYTVSVVVAEPAGTRETLHSIYVPSKHVIGTKPDGSRTVQWFEPLPQFAAVLKHIAPALKPFPSSRFPSSPTSIAPRPAPDPGSSAWPRIALIAVLGAAVLAAGALALIRRAARRNYGHGSLAPE